VSGADFGARWHRGDDHEALAAPAPPPGSIAEEGAPKVYDPVTLEEIRLPTQVVREGQGETGVLFADAGDTLWTDTRCWVPCVTALQLIDMFPFLTLTPSAVDGRGLVSLPRKGHVGGALWGFSEQIKARNLIRELNKALAAMRLGSDAVAHGHSRSRGTDGIVESILAHDFAAAQERAASAAAAELADDADADAEDDVMERY